MSIDGRHADSGPVDGARDAVMRLMDDHLPLSLLIDLGDGDGLDSTEIAQTEGGNADWLRSPAAP